MKRFIKTFVVVAFVLISAFAFVGCGKYVGEISNVNAEGYGTVDIGLFLDKNASYKDEVVDAVNQAIDYLGKKNIEALVDYHKNLAQGKKASLPETFPEFPDLTSYQNVLVVYCSVDASPFTYQGQNEEAAGVDIDIIKFAAKILNRRIEVRICVFPSISLNIKSHPKEWSISGVSVGITEERKKEVAFCNPHWQMTLNIISKKDDSFSNIFQLSGKKIGVYTAESGANYAHEKKNDGTLDSSTSIIEYNTPQSAFQAFLTYKVDAIICLDYVADALVRNR